MRILLVGPPLLRSWYLMSVRFALSRKIASIIL